MDNTFSKALAEYIANTSYETIPEEGILSAKKSILDTLGIMFPATTLAPTSDIVHDLYTELDHGDECTLVGYGEKASLLNAVMINGSLTHAVDFDDDAGIDKPITHPTASCFPAALSLAEYVGNVSGKQLIAAIALADDVVIRIGSCIRGNTLFDYDFFPPTTLGVFLATIASCKVLDLDAKQTLDALGLAVNRVAGIRDALFNCEFRSIRDAFGNDEGVRCALLASRGFEGCPDPIEQLYHVIYHDDVDTTNLLKGLGEEFYNAKYISYKPWPSCHGTYPYVQSTLETMTAYDIKPEDIARIDLTGCDQGGGLFNPKEEKRQPKTVITAKIALPYVVATAACNGTVVLADFELENLGNPAAYEMSGKIFFTEDNSYPPNSATARIETVNGDVFEKRVDVLLGAATNPISLEDLIEKFKANATLAKKPISPENIEALADKLLNLENVADISEITDLIN